MRHLPLGYFRRAPQVNPFLYANSQRNIGRSQSPSVLADAVYSNSSLDPVPSKFPDKYSCYVVTKTARPSFARPLHFAHHFRWFFAFAHSGK